MKTKRQYAVKRIRLTRKLRSEIYQRAKKLVGSNPLFEVGTRRAAPGVGIPFTANMRLWEEDADLDDLHRLARLQWIDLDDQGRCELDLYATTTHRSNMLGMTRQLETNIYVLLTAEGVLDVADVSDRHQKEWD
jgi:hypothetical protein